MLGFFERLTRPFPDSEPTQPPKGVLAFCRHYTKGMEWPLIVMSLSSALLAILEVSLFSFMGQLVDWLVTQNPESFFIDERATLIWMTLVTVVLLPLLTLFHSALVHQTLLGN
ncbi:MAG: ABC transporter ATP-binding protein, partial [Alishewanella sp.]|nr:ABC transporter ATP-binding protein [Alishewanella sp.]